MQPFLWNFLWLIYDDATETGSCTPYLLKSLSRIGCTKGTLCVLILLKCKYNYDLMAVWQLLGAENILENG